MAAPTSASDLPAAIGRYRVQQRIAAGSFGVVYRGEDVELGRPVAIKVLHRHLLESDATVNAFLLEARILAGLEHPGIVPVYDIGCTEDGLYFLVARYIEGTDLHTRLKRQRLSRIESVEVVAQGAAALAHAHQRGLIHRDVNPRNLMLDASGRVYVIDFGLALRQEDFGTGPGFVGTVPYMSPEQARGEGHRVDAGTDIYSLGVVLYELFTGRRPFTAKGRDELLELIATREPPPPREVDDSIPGELERICLKAMAFRAADRYASAQTLADDLRAWLTRLEAPATGDDPRHGARDAVAPTENNTAAVRRMIPRGLRSFTASDADFFLGLLPGPRAGDGMPESLRFWKTRLESMDPEQAFRVGLLYGPSGCGKTSLVTAGLLPRLAESVHAVYLEATADRTEAALNKALRRQFPWVAPDQRLSETVAGLRRGRGLPAGHKVVLVIDQFEQWLHAPRVADDTELVRALRQCDGLQVQCLLLVRDDFWLNVSRLMREVEVPLLEGHNTNLVDLFDASHARKVLAECGRAYGCLPDRLTDCTSEQQQFLDQAVSLVAENAKVSPVRLMLFVEMVKSQPWLPATLRSGGAEGIGVQFLEETFTAATAPTEHRIHQKAARAVLRALLPEGATNLKGHRRSREELLSASGYANQPQAFVDLLRILDRELRLITPAADEEPGAEPAAAASAPDGSAKLSSVSAARLYQLTHDYLVPSVRQWLTRAQRRTWRGRTELLLAERTADWNARPEPRHLPTWFGWASIRLLTRRPWTEPQRRMMRAADRRHLGSAAVFLVIAFVAGFIALYVRNQFRAANDNARAEALVAQIRNTDHFQPADLVGPLERYHDLVAPRLQALLDDPQTAPQERLKIRLVLLPSDPGQLQPVREALLSVAPQWVERVCEALLPYKEDLTADLWKRAEDPQATADVRLRSACALAAFAPENTRWTAIAPSVITDLLGQNSIFLSYWLKALTSVREQLIPPLARLFRTPDEQDRKAVAAEALAVYAADQPELLAELVTDADTRQFAVLWPAFSARPETARTLMERILTRVPAAAAKQAEREDLARPQAQAAAALLLLGKTDHVWPLLRHSPNPSRRSFLIHLCAPLGVNPEFLVQRYHVEGDLSVRRALLLSLGEYGESAWPAAERGTVAEKIQEVYRSAEDPGIHAAAEWLLRRWQKADWLRQTTEGWAKDRTAAAERQERIRQQLASGSGAKPQWYVTGQGQTMVVVPGPVDFVMGSPLTERGRYPIESRHRQRVSRSFAIAATSVTKEQFLRFMPEFSPDAMQYYPDPTCPIGAVTWFEAAAYCNWLSKQEGISEDQWCYETTPQGQITALKRNHPRLTGYRLPTEAEWEYACRAGAVTSRYYGQADELLEKYGWYLHNSPERTSPVASKKPNDLGLFDMHGNAWNWCQERYRDYPGANVTAEPSKDVEDRLEITSTDSRVLRGGSFISQALGVRSARRLRNVPAARYHDVGFRPARTIP